MISVVVNLYVLDILYLAEFTVILYYVVVIIIVLVSLESLGVGVQQTEILSRVQVVVELHQAGFG